MVFFGYEQGSKGYRVYDPVSEKLHVSRDVVFEEIRAWDWSTEGNQGEKLNTFSIELKVAVGSSTTGLTEDI
jgi:hypothetical protein